MRDPHVARLDYRVLGERATSYRGEATIEFSNSLGAFKIAAGKLQVSPVKHYPSQAAAQEELGRYLKSWEIDADLTYGVGTIRFVFERAELVDRNPPPPGFRQVVALAGVASGSSSVSATVEVVRSYYPPPPSAFSTTPDLESLHSRWVGFMDGKEPPLSFAYFVLTVLESSAGDRNQAAKHFRISKNVLARVGKLTSTRGAMATARKVTPAPGGELTKAEEEWLQQAVRLMIRRVGEMAGGASVSEITLASLPPL